MSVGRNLDEMLRVLEAMQFSNEHQMSLPLNWQPATR